MPTIRVLHQGDGLVAVDKPPGLCSTGDTLDDTNCAQGQLMALLRRRRVWAVHQLDKDTSGVNLFVTRKALVAEVGAQLKRRRAKHYLAVADGELAGEHLVDAPIGRRRRADGRLVPSLEPDGKPSTTEVVSLAANVRASLVVARPRTGRTHQVRLHLAWLGHPLVGERLHTVLAPDHPRHALHAWGIDLGHGLQIAAPWPADLAALALRLGLPQPPTTPWE